MVAYDGFWLMTDIWLTVD